MSLIVDSNLSAEILTGQMPLSETVTKAQSVATKAGINHGFSIEYDTSGAIPAYSTQYLKINKGLATVGAVQPSGSSAKESLRFAVELTEDLVIDLDTLSISASNTNDYYVAIQLDYEVPSVNNDTGLVASLGKQLAQILIVRVDDTVAFTTTKGLVLGKFNRNGGYIEFINEIPYTQGKIDNGTATNLLNGSVQNTNIRLGEQLYLENASNLNNLRKHICIRDLSSIDMPNLNTELGIENLDEMPLAGITDGITTLNDPTQWLLPINWLATLGIYSTTHKIWKDVESFKLQDCYIRGDLKLSFHRTPGHNLYYKWIDDGNPEYLIDPAKVIAVPDKGCKSFTFDGQGTIIDGDLDIDLVLDFTGELYKTLYKINIKNVTVKGNMTVRYGQSILALNGGAIGTIEVDNVNVTGDLGIYCWPQVNTINPFGIVANSTYTDAYGTGYNTYKYYLNSGQSTAFTGYNTSGPDILYFWNAENMPEDVLFDQTKTSTRGPLLLAYAHSINAGSGALGMLNPWLFLAQQGHITLKNSVVPKVLLGVNAGLRTPKDVKADSIMDYWETYKDSYLQPFTRHGVAEVDNYKVDTKVLLHNCTVQVATSSPNTYGLVEPIYKFKATDGTYPLEELGRLKASNVNMPKITLDSISALTEAGNTLYDEKTVIVPLALKLLNGETFTFEKNIYGAKMGVFLIASNSYSIQALQNTGFVENPKYPVATDNPVNFTVTLGSCDLKLYTDIADQKIKLHNNTGGTLEIKCLVIPLQF